MARFQRLNRTDPPILFITLTPLIDTVLVLLIVFMVTTPSKVIVKTTADKASTANVKNDDYRVAYITVNKDRITLNGIPKKIDECAACLPEAIKQSPIKTVFIKIEDAQSNTLVYKLTDAARRTGARVILG